jgi:sortase A
MIEAMRRLLSGVGRTLITAGVLLLLFVAYQLWGTGIRQAQEQHKLKNSFEKELLADGITPLNFDDLASVTAPPTTVAAVPVTEATPVGPSTTTAAPKGPTTTATTAVPAVTTSTLPQVRAGRSRMKAPSAGRKLGLIVIPRLRVRQVFVEGTAKADLETGPGRYSRSAYPGQPGNAAIAGHRTTFGAPFFNMNLMRVGDPIFVQTKQGNFRYDVIDACKPKCTGNGWFIVSPKDSSVLAATPGDNLLTLTTCHPKYQAKQRLIVRARLVGPAAADDFFIPEPTTVPPTTAPPPSSAVETSAASVETDPSTVEESVAETVATTEVATTEVPTTEVAADDGLTLTSERDPGGTGPVWKIGLFQGHRSTWTQTGLLSTLCAAIWLGFWFLARPRRLAAQAVIYSAGFMFLFLPALYFTFEVLSRLLPENL